MQPIQSALDEASRLSKSFHQWNNAYMYCVFVSAIAVAVTFIVQWKAKTQAEALEKSNNAVIRAKDDLLKEEFSHRDERIAQVHADAQIQIERVRSESNEKIAAANKRSDEISAEANLKAERLHEQNLTTESQLESERTERVRMEAAISPRILIGQNAMGDKLKQSFPKFKVKIYSLGESEAWRLAGQLSAVAYRAGWPVLIMAKFINPDVVVQLSVGGKDTSIPIPFREGVEVDFPGPRGMPYGNPSAMEEFTRKHKTATNAAEALVDELNNSHVKARTGMAIEDLPDDTLVIIVGPLPLEYFLRHGEGIDRGNMFYQNVQEVR
jgi:hypothetical protein